MDGKQLKFYLAEYVQEHGIESLSDAEIDYLCGNIGFIEYLNRCYDEYCKDSSLIKSNAPQFDQDFIYD